MEITTISSSEDDPDDPGVCIPAQSDANIADKYI